MTGYDENASIASNYNIDTSFTSFNLAASTTSTGIPRARSLGQSTSGKRIVPKRGLRTASLTIPEDVEAPIKPRAVSAPLRASMREEGDVSILGELRGGVNVKRSISHSEKEDKGKDGSAAYERRLRALEAGYKAREKRDNEKFDELNATIADLRAELAIRSATPHSWPSADTSDPSSTPRSLRVQTHLSTPTRPSVPARLAQTFDMSEFGVPASLASITGSPPVPAVVSRQKRQSLLGNSRMADISSSVMGGAITWDRQLPKTLEEDMSMGDMSFSDLANLSDEQDGQGDVADHNTALGQQEKADADCADWGTEEGSQAAETPTDDPTSEEIASQGQQIVQMSTALERLEEEVAGLKARDNQSAALVESLTIRVCKAEQDVATFTGMLQRKQENMDQLARTMASLQRSFDCKPSHPPANHAPLFIALLSIGALLCALLYRTF